MKGRFAVSNNWITCLIGIFALWLGLYLIGSADSGLQNVGAGGVLGTGICAVFMSLVGWIND